MVAHQQIPPHFGGIILDTRTARNSGKFEDIVACAWECQCGAGIVTCLVAADSMGIHSRQKHRLLCNCQTLRCVDAIFKLVVDDTCESVIYQVFYNILGDNKTATMRATETYNQCVLRRKINSQDSWHITIKPSWLEIHGYHWFPFQWHLFCATMNIHQIWSSSLVSMTILNSNVRNIPTQWLRVVSNIFIWTTRMVVQTFRNINKGLSFNFFHRLRTLYKTNVALLHQVSAIVYGWVTTTIISIDRCERTHVLLRIHLRSPGATNNVVHCSNRVVCRAIRPVHMQCGGDDPVNSLHSILWWLNCRPKPNIFKSWHPKSASWKCICPFPQEHITHVQEPACQGSNRDTISGGIDTLICKAKLGFHCKQPRCI